MDLGQAEEYLTAKKWKFFGAEQPKNGSMGDLSFAYNVRDFSDKAESFLMLYYLNDDSNYRISIQIVKATKYNEYINQIKAWGGKMIKSYVEDGSFYKIYQGSTMTYIVETFTVDDNIDGKKTGHYFSILTNEDYNNPKYILK